MIVRLNGSVNTNDLDKLPVLTREGSDFTFSFERSQQSIGSGVEVVIEVSPDLTNWNETFEVPDVATDDSNFTVVKDISSGMDRVTFRMASDTALAKFVRLKVVLTP